MMPLTLMQAIAATVTETGESTLADQIVAAWPHDAGSARFFRSSGNAVFTFTHQQQRYVLRCNHEAERSVAQISAEIDYLRFLMAVGVQVVQPVLSHQARYIERTDTQLGCFSSVVFAFAEGQQFEIDALTTEQFGAWGAALGTLHAAAQNYTHPDRPTWHDHLAWLDHTIPADEHAVLTTLANVRAQLDALPTHATNFGLIHFDFELDNLVWDDKGIVALDFDDCAWYWYVADIAFALRDLFADQASQVDLADPRLQAFVAGYRSHKAVSDAELALIPRFLQFHHVLLFARIHRALGSDQHSDTFPWAVALRGKLVQKMQRYRDLMR